MPALRRLKLDDAALVRILDELDAEELRASHGRPDQFRYRVRALRLEVQVARDLAMVHGAPARTISRTGIHLLVGNLLHTGCRCKVSLITVRDTWQDASGVIERCRYVQGTGGVHEIYVRFDRPVDPASFAPAAVRTRILVVDDSPTARRLLCHMLTPLNVEVSAAQNGIEAVRAALAEPFDLILMDIEMPEMDGLTACSVLRGKGYLRAIVAVTALTGPDDRERCLARGCDDYLAKPPVRESLAQLVNRTKPAPLVSDRLNEPEMAPLIDAFVASLPDRASSLEAAFATQEFDRLALETRVLKGEAGGYGFSPITIAAARLERLLAPSARQVGELRVGLSALVRLCLAARPATCTTEMIPVDEDALAQVD